ncbi:MAG: TonB-dependent receptor plug domain-containing protein, partial [Leptolyngbyaceae bacterium]|nr:TonB-dependent receptor plug domain-containing protein [Leptolyngbyaceae bacterium]
MKYLLLLNSVIVSLMIVPAVLAEPNLTEANLRVANPKISEVDHAGSLKENRTATTVKEWIAQIESVNQQAVVRVTNVQLLPTKTGLEIILETQNNQPLQIDASRFQAEGNSLVADIPDVELALPEGGEFSAENPTSEIATVLVTQVESNLLRIRVTGKDVLPQQPVTLKIGSLAYSFNPEAEQLDELEITVIGTRTPRLTRLTPGSISVTTAQDIDELLVQDLRDLFRYQPNISVGNNRRYGLQDINIRGLGGNRVLILNDGIRLPTQFQFGPTTSIGRDYVDLETLQQVEVIRGPASALYGSDALGGVVTFRTVDPSDFLDRFDRQDS